MSKIEIINADALINLKELPNESIDLIIADPPYNLKKNYGNNSDDFTHDEYLVFSRQWLTESKRVLKKTGTIYVFMGVRYISYIYHIMEKELNLNFNSWITWHYTQGLGKTKGFSPRHDDILFFSKTNEYKFNLDSIRIPQKYYRSINNMRGANPGDVWQFSHVHYCNENRQDHPTQKPEGLMERMVLASSDINDNILDPFSGSGTTLRVCQQLNRNCIGIEINPDYVKSTENRLAKKFTSFDSIDPRMERVPYDLRDEKIREEYLKNHIQWFLQHHNSSIETFYKSVEEIYGVKYSRKVKKIDLLESNLFNF
ncbi:MAG: restriction endonuclease [Spirochaetes bacterium GWD1_27_9]|nr:MAG: restriction endonuclease [Spirochaetes bacterium GWB1_27_13]OHD21427.1 MAG: restriction endonuclease [Spirochaetes bacterium GWC1_27_15]OHD28626.1 MAG: restriction endonuclease [Spirochaetes bacterium GWD1_27_9]